MTTRACVLLLLLADVAAADPGSTGDVESFWYQDPAVQVATFQGRGRQVLGEHVGVDFGVVVDRIEVTGGAVEDDDDDDDDDDDKPGLARALPRGSGPDAVTGASTTPLVQAGPEWRVEGSLGIRALRAEGTHPAQLGVRGIASAEDDYDSVAGVVDGSIELRVRTITLSGFIGGGHDRSTPLDDAPSPSPTSSARGFAGASVGLVATERVVLYGGAAVTVQDGSLANPYRLASVAGDELPEVLPGSRVRTTAFVQVAWAAGAEVALHARNGIYADTWGVLAWIPELALVRQLGERVLVTAGYRYYRQGAATFHRATYDRVERYLSGDPRLGALTDHTGSLDVTWRREADDDADRSWSLRAGYALSALRPDGLGLDLAHTIHAGIGGTY